MKRSKVLFIVLVIIFLIVLILIAFDFSSKTTFPGQKRKTLEQTYIDSISQEEEGVS